jgi:hypothetical protein
VLRRSPYIFARNAVATRHTTAPTATETSTPPKRTPRAAAKAAASAAALPTTCQKKRRAPSRHAERFIRYEPPKAATPALQKESTSTAAHAPLSVAGAGQPSVRPLSGPAVSLSVQTASVAATAAEPARKPTAHHPRDSGSAQQNATSAARTTPTSPSKSSIERKTNPSAKGKCQPPAGRES